jgi:hypothetical protein
MCITSVFRLLLLYSLLYLSLSAPAHAQQIGTELPAPSFAVEQASIVGLGECDCCDSVVCGGCNRPSSSCFGGAEFLFARPHFSEAVAYAQGSQTATTFDVSGQPIHFDYDAGFRAFAGMRLGGTTNFLRMSYTYLQGDVSIDGGLGASQFIVDPFGNVLGTVQIIDPSDARSAGPPVVGPGDLIQTNSTVDAHVYDLDFAKIWDDCYGWELRLDAGVRIADIDQTYQSVITLAGAPLSDGFFSAAFTGAGPHLGLEGKKYCGKRNQVSMTASAHGALLLGDYDVSFRNALGGGAFVANQSNTQRRVIPVFETELGGGWRATKNLELSAGWLFHVWNDMGVSGGTFGGLFGGSDDANNMSFDGLVLRAEFRR